MVIMSTKAAHVAVPSKSDLLAQLAAFTTRSGGAEVHLWLAPVDHAHRGTLLSLNVATTTTAGVLKPETCRIS